MATEEDDGVNREGLDYRAGWCEALQAFAQRLQVECMRAKKADARGLELAGRIAGQLFESMIGKMRQPPV